MENSSIGKVIIIILVLMFGMPILISIFAVGNILGIDVNLEKEITITPTFIFIVMVVIIIIWVVSKYNKFARLKEKVRQARSGIDVYLKQRFDLIPNLVETVKAYSHYEKSVLQSIVELRNKYDARNKDDLKESEELNNQYTNLLGLVENYPELKASESYLNLQKALRKIESQLQAARRIYNSEVTNYNVAIKKFPALIIARIFGYKEEALFEIVESERQNVNIDV